jgi:hypothetical protein
MSEESDRDELQALKDGFEAHARQAPRREVDIAFSHQGCRQLGHLISRAAIDEHKRQKSGPVSFPKKTEPAR